MDAKRLEKSRRRLTAKTPLIGGWLRRMAVSSLIEDGSFEATMELAEAATRDQGEVDPVAAAQYAPHEARQRALFYFLTGQWDEYESLDFDRAFLCAAYGAGDPRLRGRIAEQARRSGRSEWIEVVTGGRRRKLKELDGKEWDVTLAVLFANSRWNELWRLAQEASPRRSAQILQRMKNRQWSLSSEEEQRECKKLMGLADRWKAPDLIPWSGRETVFTSKEDVRAIAISPEGNLIAAGMWWKGWTSQEWSLSSGKLIRRLRGERSGRHPFPGATRVHDDFTISIDKRLVVTGSNYNEAVNLWSLIDGELVMTLEGHRYGVARLAISQDGQWLVSLSVNRRLRRAIRREYDNHEGELKVSEVILRKLGEMIIASMLFIPSCGEIVECWETGGWASLVFAILFFPIAAGSGVWLCIPTFDLVSTIYKSLFDWWANTVVWLREKAEVRLWSLPDGQLRILEGDLGQATALAVNPEGRLLATGTLTGSVQLWSLPDGELIRTLESGKHGITCLAFSPDGRFLASGSRDRTVRMWSLLDGQLIATGEERRYDVTSVTSLAFSPDSRTLASGNVIRLWTMDIIRLGETPIVDASRADFDWVQERLRDEKTADSERRALEFIDALMRRQRRFDIAIEESRPRIEAGEFDIEIGG